MPLPAPLLAISAMTARLKTIFTKCNHLLSQPVGRLDRDVTIIHKLSTPNPISQASLNHKCTSNSLKRTIHHFYVVPPTKRGLALAAATAEKRVEYPPSHGDMPVPRCVIAQPEVVKVGDPKKTSTESKSKGGAISAIFTDVVVEGIAGQVKKLIDDGFNAGVKGMQKVIDDQAGNIVELRNEVKVLKQMGEEDKEELKMLREFRSRVLEAVKSAGGGVGGP